MEKESRGTTTVGKGSVDYFAVLNKNDISMDAYTEIYVRFKNSQNLDAYSDEYKDQEISNTLRVVQPVVHWGRRPRAVPSVFLWICPAITALISGSSRI